MNQQQRDVTIVNKQGLHARPAMQFVDTANQFDSTITVVHGDKQMDGKSIMSVMQLAATMGTTLRLIAEGDDAGQALEALDRLVAGGFGEE
ncbi:MAG: HPr family phosphocarrier protein [Planctomycetes bacterium]|mgnify:CR=1 FL=1|nr:HPr family phosphocarrier protein [Planctomycetota bacterium]